MNRSKFLNFMRANAKKGEFQAVGNTIYVYDVIVASDADAEFWGGVSPEAFAKALAGMSGDVHLRINSPGGDVFAARAMVQAMSEYDSGQIIAHVDGWAASAASLIAVSADKTIMAPGSFLMIHKAWTWTVGNSDDHRASGNLLDQIDTQIADLYAAASGGTAGDFTEKMAAETWYSPPAALEAGLIDEIAPDKSEKTTASASLWDASAIAAKAPPPPSPSAYESEHRRRRLAARLLAPAA